MLAVWRPACTAGLFSFGMAGVQWRDRLHSSQGIVCREGAWWGWKQIPPCSLRSLVGMTRILVQGGWIALFGVRGVGMAADSSLLAALARRNDKDFWFLCAGVTGRRAIVTAERESKSPPCRKVRDKGGAPSSLDSNYLELSYATGLNLFAAGIV